MQSIRNKRYSIPIAVLLSLSTCVVFGATEADGIDTIVVTASRIQRPAEQIVQAVEVIDREAIDARQASNVTELLRQLTGANIIQQGARGGVTSIVLRGGESNFTVVMIDGIKVNDSTNTRGGSYDFSYLDISAVDRVEIVRGPMSAVYGSDALSGVINIITRKDAGGAQVGVMAGGHGLRAGNLRFGGRVGSVDAEIGAHALNEDGDIEGSSYQDAGVDGSLRIDIGDDGEAGLNLRYLDADSTSFPEDSGGPVFAVIRDVDTRSVKESHARIYWDNSIGSNWRGHASLSRYDRTEKYTSPGIAPGVYSGVPPNAADTNFTRDQLSFSAATSLNPNLSVVVGAEWQREQGDSAGVIDIGFPLPTDFELERDTLSAFTEFDWSTGPFRLQGSLRWDNPDEIDDVVSAQIGAIFALPGEAGELRANWGQGFKAPSFFALGHPLVGNADLYSETADSIDIGYRKRLGRRASFEVSVYHNEYKNLIDFDPELFTNVNRSLVVAEGVEITGGYTIGESVNIQGHLTWSDAEIQDSDAILRGRPQWRGGLVVDWAISQQWLLAASFLIMDEFWEVSVPTGGLYLDGYNRLDLALTYAASAHLKLGLAIDNALDADYMEAVGFPAAGVRGRLQATYRF